VRFQRRAGLAVSCEVVWAKPNLAHVLAYVNDFHADLVIKTSSMSRPLTGPSINPWIGCCCAIVRPACTWSPTPGTPNR